MGSRNAYSYQQTSYEFGDGKRRGCCTCKRTCCVIGVLLLLLILTVAITLLVAFVKALLMQSPEYVDSSTMQRIYDHPNMTSSNYHQLPALLGTALTFPTIVSATGDYDAQIFQGFRDFLKNTFTNVFNSSYVEVTDRFPSFLLTVQGEESSSNNSFLLMGHFDVVPVDHGSWRTDPFSGAWEGRDEEDGGRVVGRGAIDDKTRVLAMLCALDDLLAMGWSPNTTFYLAFGHDEEVQGHAGAAELAKVLQEKGVEDLFFILDEGMPIVDGLIPGVDVPIATIGVSEKGYMTVRVEATGAAGHSSIPPHEQATHRLATALHNLHTSPHPTMLGAGGPEEHMLAAIAPQSSWPHRLILSNPVMFRPALSAAFSMQKETDALQRTTTATTIIKAGVKSNVVPGTAWALVNHRVHPGQSLSAVLQHDIDAIADDAVNVTILSSMEAAPVSPYGPESPAFSLIAATVNRVYPSAVPAPSLLIANTDTIHYLQFSRNVYRFNPLLLTKDDISGIHGNDESITAANVWKAAQFYHSLILSADAGVVVNTSNNASNKAN